MERTGVGAGVLPILLMLSWFAAEPAASQEYQVALDAPRSVRFVSRASIEEFEGVTDRIDGYVLLDGEALTTDTGGDDTEFYFEVELASLDTGVGLRNRHMRDNYLEVERFPYATYQGHIVRSDARTGGTFRVGTTGVMSIHGVERETDIGCDVAEEDGGYRVRCSFQVLLSDFDIDIPRVMFLKLANDIRLELDFAVRPAGEGDAR